MRLFTDDFPMERTNVGFHGHYDHDGKLLPDLVSKTGCTTGSFAIRTAKADPALVERWINIPVKSG